MSRQEDGKAAFEALLDASWIAFRRKMVEAYESAARSLPARQLEELSSASTRPSLDIDTMDPPRPSCPSSLEPQLLLPVRPKMVDEEEPVPCLEDAEHLSLGPIDDRSPQEDAKKVGPRASLRDSRGRSSAVGVSQVAKQRLRLRLSVDAKTNTLISGKSLAQLLGEMGLTGYNEDDMNLLVNQVADYVSLQFMKEETCGTFSGNELSLVLEQEAETDLEKDTPHWHWPDDDEPQARRRSWVYDFQPRSPWDVCPANALIELLLVQDKDLIRKVFGPRTRKQFETMRELLQKWDPNDLAAELMQARANDLNTSEATAMSKQEISSQEAQAIRQRLRVRLGVAVTSKRLVSGRALHMSMEALGLTSYTEDNMNVLVNVLADFIDLQFSPRDPKSDYRRSHTSRESQNVDLAQLGIGTIFNFQDDDSSDGFGEALWQWPPAVSNAAPMTPVSHLSSAGAGIAAGTVSMAVNNQNNQTEKRPQRKYNVVPLQALMDVFLIQDTDVHRKIFGSRMLTQFEAMQEILLAGDTNRLVAELTFVRINDLAAPPEKAGVLVALEPLVAFLIIANGIMIGFQTHPEFEDWGGWPTLELVFVVVLILECVLRMFVLGCRRFFCGSDRLFNWFDLFLSLSGLADVFVQKVMGEQSDMLGMSLLRFCRLIRLVRVVKVFRLRCMKELRLMVKGLVAGFRTLCLSFVLLVAVLYVISGFATMTIGSDIRTTEMGLMIHFETVPASMFTAFLCFAGECIDRSGRPIPTLMAETYGFPFVMGYVVSYMLVSMGIFNVILAVYVDITMKAAKETEAVTAEQHARESIRIARTTRELLKKFAAAYRLYQDAEESNKMSQLDFNTGSIQFTDNDIHAQIAITKELFLLVIQDRHVQSLMDDLDLPPDRANLFEAIDADGSGTLHVTELVQGLLQIRGEVKKSDAVATLLSTKALQHMVAEMREELGANLQDLRTTLREDTQSKLDDLHAALANCQHRGDGPRRLRSAQL